MMFDEYATVREERLERRRYALGWTTSERIQYDRYEDQIHGQMVHRLCLDVFGRPSKQIVTFEPVSYPATWWQAFKQRFFPRWALRRWPIQFTTVKRPDVVVEAEALFPELVPMKEQRSVVVWFYASPPKPVWDER